MSGEADQGASLSEYLRTGRIVSAAAGEQAAPGRAGHFVKSRSLICTSLIHEEDQEGSVVRFFRFMSLNQAYFPVATMARVIGVSRAGFYAWRQRPPPLHAIADAALLRRMKTVHASSRQTYGAPRVHADLRTRGERHGRKRITWLMREAGLVGASHQYGGPTTTRRGKDARLAPDLVDRNVTASRPDQLWVADITYVPSAAGFLYLAVVLDAWSRRIVGWSMADHLRAELVLDAMEAAVWL